MLDVRFILCYLSTITDNTSIFYFVGGVGGGGGERVYLTSVYLLKEMTSWLTSSQRVK